MTRRETRWLTIGILLGALVTAGAAVAVLKWSAVSSPASLPAGETAMNDSAPASAHDTGGGQSTVQLSPTEQTQIGLQTTVVRRQTLTVDISAIGRVEESETAIGTVSTRFGGRVEKLFVNFAGQPVQKGDAVASIAITGQPVGKDDPVASIYNLDVIAAAEEYKFALGNRERAHASSRPEATKQAEALVEASRVRLERWGLTPDQIDGVLARPEQPVRMTIYSERTGTVRSRKVSEGQFVNPGDALLELTDLSTLWVKANVFDPDIAKIRPGLTAGITSEALPGLKLSGTVDFIGPHSDPQTRTTPVRIQVVNPGARLKPGMVVQSSFRIVFGNMVTVPRSAVIDSGIERVVYVAQENGLFQKRTIQTGEPSGDFYAVTGGLAAGERVVTNGVFLLDSQSRFTGGMTGMFGGSKSFTETTAAPPSSGAFKITFRIDPDPPRGAKENTIHVTVTDAAGKAVSDAQVRMTLVMPAMPTMNMPEMRSNAELKWTGSEYTGPVQVMMSGGWNATVEARRGNELLATHLVHLNAR